MTGIFEDVVDSIFNPGVNRGLLVFLHTACGALITTLIAIAVYTRGNIHVLALLGIATGLWLSITWFTKELQQVQQSGNAPAHKRGTPRRAKAKEDPTEESTLSTPKRDEGVPIQKDGTPVRRSARSVSRRRND